MFLKTCGWSASFIVAIALGLFIGYAMKPQVKVVIYDQAVCSPGPTDFWKDNNRLINEFRDTDPDLADQLIQMKKIRPLVKAGPFTILWNPNNGDYVIYDMVDQQAIAMQITEGEETNLTFNGKDAKVCCDLFYSKGDNRLIHSLYFSGDKGDGSGLPKYSYLDKDGNGQFDIMVDREAGLRYEQKALQWVKMTP